jgi:hypothetical protein
VSTTEDINTVWDRRACPLCGSSKISTKPNSSARHPAEFMPWETAKSYFIGLRSDQVFFSYYRCQDCELLYCPWYFNSKQISELYAAMPDNTMGEDKSTVSKTQSAYARWIMRPGVSNSRYLEVGPDIGLVAKEIVNLNSPQHITFLEPNQSVKAELIFNVSGIESIEVVDFIESMKETNFSLVAGVHVYDHLLKPLQDLQELRKNVSPGAHLAIVVHNEKSTLRKLLNSKWPPFCLQHPQLYNPESLKEILKLAGWEVISTERSTNWYHLKHFMKMGAGVLGIPTVISKLAPNIEVPIKLGNMISISQAI